MKKWLYKSLVVSVALLTFGMITPKHEIWTTLEYGVEPNRTHESSGNDLSAAFQLDTILLEDSREEASIDTILSAAKQQSYIKFGSRIGPVIENEFETNIFPKMEEAIEITLARLGNDAIQSLTITEKPSGAYSEKIFHIIDNATAQDVIRFHVRTENRPFDGFYYNFHYHTMEDSYVTHYNLGEIYWSKNTPPKWLS
ncbi:YpjP family protein [Solibacillus sp. FSL H8-0538]|uniref:YpjP family protein n=1 Tax=Solibacillus sp. FSL H8-0538 TaxID=2921400 RepID=UPI0030FAAC06